MGCAATGHHLTATVRGRVVGAISGSALPTSARGGWVLMHRDGSAAGQHTHGTIGLDTLAFRKTDWRLAPY